MTDIIILDDGVWRSWAKDLGYAVIVLGFMGVGAALGSDPMQAVGFLAAMTAIVSRVIDGSRGRRKTPQEAADYLAAKYNVVASQCRTEGA